LEGVVNGTEGGALAQPPFGGLCTARAETPKETGNGNETLRVFRTEDAR
jgi:hypothetical protein